ncbi:MAG TPA: hypothetical protein VFC31_13060 [Candidatus Limnocylindria bacterium]|nr:hypothetical protein [Candidatus Limnocylindria bacterium]
MDKPPTYKAVSEEIRAIFPVLYRAFEEATAKAKDYFVNQGRPIDWQLYPDLVRYEAKVLLVRAGHDAQYEMEELSRNGLMAVFFGYPTRIRKADNGTVPLPGNSQPYMGHLNQQAWLSLDGERKWNLMALWDTTTLGLLSSIKLALTASATKTSVENYWIETIPHPAAAQQPPTPPAEGKTEVEREDIDIGPAASERDERADEGK